MRFFKTFNLIALVLLINACANTQPQHNPTPVESLPLSILALPPLNNSNDVRAPYSYLSTVSQPLAEAGYYVFPVAMVAEYMRANGLPTPYEMHQVPLDKLRDIFGAEAVLYITIEEYGQQYSVLNSATVVKAKAHLVLTDTGERIWEGIANIRRSSDSGNSLAESLLNAVVTQVIKANGDPAHKLSREANWQMLRGYRGLEKGQRYPTCDTPECAH